jgi:FkbH-like protein
MRLNKLILKKSLSLLVSIVFFLSTVTQAVPFDDIDFSYISQNHLRPSATVVTKKTGQKDIATKLIDANMHSSYNSTLGNLQEVPSEKASSSGVDSRTLSGKMNQLIGSGKSVPASLKERIMDAYTEEQLAVLLQDKDFEIRADNSKYESNSGVKPFEGVTTVASMSEGATIYGLFESIIKRLNNWQINHLPKNKRVLATVPVESIHVTTYDGVCKDDWEDKYNKQLNDETKKEIEKLVKERSRRHGLPRDQEQVLRKEITYEVVVRRITEALRTFTASKVPEFVPTGIAAFPPHFTPDKTVLTLNIAPKSAEDLAALTKMQDAIEKATGIRNFVTFKGHITLGYFVNDATTVGHQKIDEFKEFVRQLDEEVRREIESDKQGYVFTLPQIELSYFEDMDSFPAIEVFSWTGNKTSSSGANYVNVDFVLDIIDPASSQVNLVGGKAASLRELGSIPGISVPNGFNVTTKVYEEHLYQINVNPLILELERLSEQWKELGESDPKREFLTSEMEKVAEKIRNHILKGTLTREMRNLILSFYSKLNKEKAPVLVAVRSSATAEDMPEASFAGQYKTYLNQLGNDQVIEAIKKVWASTYEMRPIEYRNKNNMQHSKNKMCALILEMVNPQSSGTAFTVDLETGSSFISINNSYGLGEAEVSGIVTSDTWIVDPITNVILKRRMGEKGSKIIYDSTERSNITVDNDELARTHFAMSKDTAKRIAVLVKKIRDHYVKNNPNLNHMDIEYAITDDGRIIFTQARPETVWTSGERALLAIDAKQIERINKAAIKAGKATPYPEIFKGGVSGASGIARGTLRVVSNVQEAESIVEFGDIMVAPNTTNAWEHVMGRTSGIITEIGGPGNHTAVVSREQGKAAIVGAINAMQSLKMYEGKTVTIDATSKRVYLNSVPEELEYNPSQIQPDYGGLYSQTLEESWAEAQHTMTTASDPDGTHWINKPNQKVRRFLQKVFTRSHHRVAEMLGLQIVDRFMPDEKNDKIAVYQVRFDTIYPWMTELAQKPIEGPDSLSSIHRARVENVRDFLQKSENLQLAVDSISAWLESFIELNAYMGFAFNMYKITEGLLQEALKKKQIPEPYHSQVWLSMAAWVGETEAIKRSRDYGFLLEKIKKNKALREAIRYATKHGFAELEEAYPEFYSRFDEHAFNYKIMKNTDDIFTSDPFHFLLAQELLRDADNDRTIGIYDTKPEQFYPEDLEFERIARLAFFSEKLRQDAHHFKVRGQWKFVEVLRPLADFLIERGVIKSFGDIFDHAPEWILDRVKEYEEAGFPAVSKKPLFHIKHYQIQDLEASDKEYTPITDGNQAYFTTMGRWRYVSAIWDHTANKITLVNALRIEEKVKPEFLENGKHIPRNITLSTRLLNDQEWSKIRYLAKHLDVDISNIIVIKLDQIAAFNRIYGLYNDGVLFIREDIFSEGSHEEIHEALDHLRLKPTGLDYEALKKIQYYGNLRDLITRLSHRTVKWKLFAQKPTEESHFLELKEYLRLSDKDYDFVTREMLRRDISFEEARLLLQDINRQQIPAEHSDANDLGPTKSSSSGKSEINQFSGDGTPYPKFEIIPSSPMAYEQADLLRSKIRNAIADIGVENIRGMDPVKFCRILAEKFNIGFIDMSDESDQRKVEDLLKAAGIEYEVDFSALDNYYMHKSGAFVVEKISPLYRLWNDLPEYKLADVILSTGQHKGYIFYNSSRLRGSDLLLYSTAIHEITEYLVAEAGGVYVDFQADYGHNNIFVLERELEFAFMVGEEEEVFNKLRAYTINRSVYDTQDAVLSNFLVDAEKFYIENTQNNFTNHNALDHIANLDHNVGSEAGANDYGMAVTSSRTYYSPLSSNDVKRYLLEAFSILKIDSLENAQPLIDFLLEMRKDFTERSDRDLRCVDDYLIKSLPELARAASSIEDFINILFIESQLFRVVSSHEKLYEFEGYCQDYGMPMAGSYSAWIMKNTVFSMYFNLLPEKEELSKFVRIFSDELRRNPALVKELNNIEKLRNYIVHQISESVQGSTQPKKCLVLDCDGVLWNGVVGEDGIKGIKVTPNHQALQRRVKELKERGVIITLNSKNNPEDVERVFERHPDMVLRRDDFAAIRVNWQDKATNMREIAEELNIGLDSFVFLDDSPRERELIRMVHPEVLTLDFPENIEEITEFLSGEEIFGNQDITEEDKRRTELYEAVRQRSELKEEAASLEDFYRSLNMRVIIRKGSENLAHISRIAQLTQRTNQFNLTTRRYTEDEIKNRITNSGNHANTYYSVYTLELLDRFGNGGIVGVLIVKSEYSKEGHHYNTEIEEFCLSCRAVGLTLEAALLSYAIKYDNQVRAVGKIKGIYVPTQKNSLVKDLYKNLGFVQINMLQSGEIHWELDLNEVIEWPVYIKLLTVHADDKEKSSSVGERHKDSNNSQIISINKYNLMNKAIHSAA